MSEERVPRRRVHRQQAGPHNGATQATAARPPDKALPDESSDPGVPPQRRAGSPEATSDPSSAPAMLAARIALALIFVMLVAGLVYSYLTSLE
jgi:hypothetical protein